MANNAAALGVTTPGLLPGDRVLTIDGDPAQTFADIQIASAMSRPGVPVRLTVEREGVAEPLHFTLMPEKDTQTGLRSVGIGLAASTNLRSRDEGGVLQSMLRETGLAASGMRLGMRLQQVDGHGVSTFEQLQEIVDGSDGNALTTLWTAVDEQGEPVGQSVTATLAAEPNFQNLRDPDAGPKAVKNYDTGLFGLTPLVEIIEVLPGSANKDLLFAGDVVLSAAGVRAPRHSQFLSLIQSQPPGEVPMTVLRDGKEVAVSAVVQRRGMFKSAGVLNVRPGLAWGTPIIAKPMDHIAVVQTVQSGDGKTVQDLKTIDTPVASLRLLGGARIDAVNGVAAADWFDIREQLRVATQSKLNSPDGATVSLTITNPTPGREGETGELQLSAADVEKLHALGWHTDLPPDIFEPIYTVRTADGNPFKAVAMGFVETKKLVLMTYLTIDRLIRGSVGVDQLRGPVGIVHIGAKVADKGLLYSLFFLGMISVNLAVINFLPLPIVDGGLFLFLIYEKLKGRPPSIAFQNAATIVGLCIIVTLFVVTFYNDVVRLFS
jgi:regulator of sigma E protease